MSASTSSKPTYGANLEDPDLKVSRYLVGIGFQGSSQVQFRLSQFSEIQLKFSTSRGGSEKLTNEDQSNVTQQPKIDLKKSLCPFCQT